MSNSVLLYVPGVPVRPEALMPLRGLAVLAGCLAAAGHRTRILDYAALNALRQFASPGLRAAARQLATPKQTGWSWSRLMGVRQSQSSALLLEECLERRAQQIAQDVDSCMPLDFVVFWIETRDDLQESLRAARQVRRMLPGIRCAVAGPYVRAHGAVMLSETNIFDCALAADEELSIPALAEHIRDPREWHRIPNLLYCEKNAVIRTLRKQIDELDNLPSARYDAALYPAVASGEKINLFTLEQSRGGGQQHRHAALEGESRTVRTRTATRLCDEMERLFRQQGARAFHVTGEFTPATQVDALAYAMISRGIAAVYSRASYCGLLNPASAALLYSSGAQAIGFQVDTGSQRLLEDFYGHCFGVSLAENVLGSCRDAGLFTGVRLTYPCPQDDYHTHAETLRLLQRTRPDAITAAAPWITPGCAWWSRAAEFGFHVDHARYARWIAASEDSPGLPPFRMTGWSGGRPAAERENLYHLLAEEGWLMDASEIMGLMARVAGYEGQESVFCTQLRQRMWAWDMAGLSELIAEFNDRATAPTNTIPFRPFVPVLAAVGN